MKSVLSHIIIAVIAFSIGLYFGIREGWWQSVIYNGLLEASKSRYKLTYIKNGGIEDVKGLEEVNLQAGLVSFYEYKNYKYPFLFFPAEADYQNYEKEFMKKIIAFVDSHPETLRRHWDPNMIMPKTEEEKYWKQEAIKNTREFERKLTSVLDQYRTSTSNVNGSE